MKNYTTKELNKNAFDYILNAVNPEGYGLELHTDVEKMAFVADCFKNEYLTEWNLKSYGSYQNCFAEWLKGLPSSFNIDYENYRIIELAKEWHSIPQSADDRQEDKILNNWWNFIAAKTLQLMNKHKIYLHR